MKKVLFGDFDGTLVHSHPLWSVSLLRAIQTLQPDSSIELADIRARMHEVYPWDLPETESSKLIGPEWWAYIFRRFIKIFMALGVGEKTAGEASRLVREYILSPDQYRLYEDAAQTLDTYLRKGYENHILSNNYPELPDTIRQLGTARYFTDHIVSGAYGYEKPRPELFAAALRVAGHPGLCYMIEDNPSADIVGGPPACGPSWCTGTWSAGRKQTMPSRPWPTSQTFWNNEVLV